MSRVGFLVATALSVFEAQSGDVNVWYPNDSVEVRLDASKVRADGCYMLSVTDWRERTLLTRSYDPSTNGKVILKADECSGFGAFRVEVAEMGSTNGPIAKTWFARLTSRDVKPVGWIGTCAHMQRWKGYADGRFIDMLTAAGVGLVRDDQCWHVCETPRGVYRPWPAFDKWFNALSDRGIGMVVMLAMWDPPAFYEDRKDFSGFPGFCAYMASIYRGRNCVFEIFNEPQNTRIRRVAYAEEEKATGSWDCWLMPFMDAAKRAAAAIHTADPSARVYVLGEDKGDLLRAMIGTRVASVKEGVSFHPYDKYPEEQEYWFRDGGAEIRALAKEKGGAVRFCATEAGMPTIASKDFHHSQIAGNNFVATYERQAAVVTRLYLLSRLTGLDFLCQYNWMDEGDDEKYTEHNFGQLFKDCTPKPSFAATAQLARVLGTANVVGEMSPDLRKWRLAEFDRKDKGDRVFVAWSVRDVCEVPFPVEIEGAEFTDLMGNPIPVPKTEGGLLRLDECPVYARIVVK